MVRNKKNDNILMKSILRAAAVVAFTASIVMSGMYLSGTTVLQAAETTAEPVGTGKPVTSVKPGTTASPTIKPTSTPTADRPADKDELNKKDYLTIADVDRLTLVFNEKDYAVIEDNEVGLGVTTNIPDKFMRLSYSVNGYCAGISSSEYNKTELKVNGFSVGSATVEATLSVEYCDSQGVNIGTKVIKASVGVEVLPIRNLTMDIGEQYTYDYTQYRNYYGMTYVFGNPAVASADANGVMTALGDGYTDVYLVSKNNRINVGSVTVNKLGICFAETSVCRAVGSGMYALVLNNVPSGYGVRWSSSNPSSAAVDGLGNVTPVSMGVTTITATVVSASGVKIPYTCTFSTTNPVLTVTNTNLAKDCDLSLGISGTTGKAEWISLQPKTATVYSDNYYSVYSSTAQSVPMATVHALKTGNAVISVNVDGITLSCNVTVTNPQLKKSFYVISKSTKATLKVTGTNANSRVRYTAVNSAVASVSGKGVVKSRKYGYSMIKAEVDGAVLTASINIGTKKGVKAVLNALKAEGARYSQARRMQKGYYDCSSLVWRAYSPVGALFGNRHYAPVAATEASYCVSHKKSVSVKYAYKLNKLRPGDLFFFKGKKNGRYKNIYHVAIYMGQEGTSYYGSTYTAGRIIHANGSYVAQSYMYNQDNIAVIGRVFK